MGMDLKSGWNIAGILSIVVMICIVLFCLTGFQEALDSDLRFTYIVNISTDIVGMSICILLFATVLLDRRINMSTIYFMALLVLECLILFWDYEAWVVNYDPSKVTYNKIVNYYVYGFILIIMMTFWLYLKYDVVWKDRALKYIDFAYYAAFFIGMLYIVSNAWTGMIFTVDPDTGEYNRQEGYVFTLICPLVMIILTTFVTHRYVGKGRKKLALYSYTLFPIVATVISSFISGLNILYIALLFSLMLIYGNFFIERGRELVEKETELVEQKVAIMISQIQPRFLYNALNSIKDIEGNPPETRLAIEEFGRYMRGNLDTLLEKEAIPFEKEMKHVSTYVELEKLRFKDKLKVRFEIDDTNFAIPALTLQMLVENAIKHGITQREEGGTVMLKTYERSDAHIMIVKDNGVGFDTARPLSQGGRSHIGIANVKQRVSDMMGGTLEIRSKIGKGTVAIVTIPKRNDLQ